MSALKRLVREAHRRSLWQVLAIYVAASWVVFEVVQTLTEGLGLPGWFPSFAFVLLLIGLPVVLATAFVQEGGPGSDGTPGDPRDLEGILTEGEPTEAASRAGAAELFTWRNALLGGMAAFALWGVVAAGWILLGESPPVVGGKASPERPSVAVLPFDNLSDDEETTPFLNGIHDDLLTQLAKIESLDVISRTSVMEYRDAEKSIPEIAREVGAGAIVEGGIQRSGERIRVNAQLIAAEEDEHLWAETFDRRLTTENIFEIQSELARRIASALEAELTPDEKTRIAERPTGDLEAYDFYVRGLDYRSRGYAEDDLELAVRAFRRSVREDSMFTEAWAALSEVHSFLYHLGFDRTDERLSRAKGAVDRALELETENPLARLALGLYRYRGFQEYGRALDEYRRAADGLPGDVRVRTAMAAAHRRAGDWESALRHLRRAAELDPRSAQAHYELGATYYLMRRYGDAIPHLERAAALAPDWGNPYSLLRDAKIVEDGSLESGTRVLERFPDDEGLDGTRYVQRLRERDYARALEIARTLDEPAETQWGVIPGSFARGEVLLLLGRDEEARAALDSARTSLEGRLDDDADDPRVHRVLGETYALLGRNEDALRHGNRAVELYSVEKDALDGTHFLNGMARIRVLTGNEEGALALLDRIISIPGWMTPADLRYDPVWEPLRNEPRFEAFLEEYGLADGR